MHLWNFLLIFSPLVDLCLLDDVEDVLSISSILLELLSPDVLMKPQEHSTSTSELQGSSNELQVSYKEMSVMSAKNIVEDIPKYVLVNP